MSTPMRLPTAQQKRSNATFHLLFGMKFKSKCQAARLKLKLISRASRRRRKPLMTCFCRSKGFSSERSGHGKTKLVLVGKEATQRRLWGIDFRFSRNGCRGIAKGQRGCCPGFFYIFSPVSFITRYASYSHPKASAIARISCS